MSARSLGYITAYCGTGEKAKRINKLPSLHRNTGAVRDYTKSYHGDGNGRFGIVDTKQQLVSCCFRSGAPYGALNKKSFDWLKGRIYVVL